MNHNQVGSHGNQSLSEASASAQSAAQKSSSSPAEAPQTRTLPNDALEVEQAIYLAYVEARVIRDRSVRFEAVPIMEMVTRIDKILDGLHAARRFVFDTRMTKVGPLALPDASDVRKEKELLGADAAAGANDSGSSTTETASGNGMPDPQFFDADGNYLDGPHYGTDCPVGKVQIEFVGVSPELRYSPYGWKPCEHAFIEIYVDGKSYNVQIGTFESAHGPRRGLHIIAGADMQVDRHSINAVDVFSPSLPDGDASKER